MYIDLQTRSHRVAYKNLQTQLHRFAYKILQTHRVPYKIIEFHTKVM